MTRRTKFISGALLAGAGIAAAIGGAVAAGAGGDDDGNERPITGDALTKASDAALAHLGEGSVTETEEGDEESYYEVEVTLADGSQVDVQLDRSFNVVGTEDDGTGDANDAD